MHLHQALHVEALTLVAEVLGFLIAGVKGLIRFDDIHRQGKNRVLVEGFGLLHPLLQTGFVGEDGLLEGLGHILSEVAIVFQANAHNLARHEVGGNVLVEQAKQRSGHILVEGHGIVLEEGLHGRLHLFGSGLDVGFVGLLFKHLVDAHEPAAEGDGLATVPAGLAVVDKRLLDFVQDVPLGFDAREDVAIFGLALRVGVDPVHEVFLLGHTLLVDVVAFELLHLTDVIFPIVRHAGLLGGVHDEHLLVGVHVLAVVLELGGAAVDDGGAFFFDDVLHRV